MTRWWPGLITVCGLLGADDRKHMPLSDVGVD